MEENAKKGIQWIESKEWKLEMRGAKTSTENENRENKSPIKGKK